MSDTGWLENNRRDTLVFTVAYMSGPFESGDVVEPTSNVGQRQGEFLESFSDMCYGLLALLTVSILLCHLDTHMRS
jgi:hypothetical protein